jgi:hypothetical protein
MCSKRAKGPSCITGQSKSLTPLGFAWFLAVSILTLPLGIVIIEAGLDNSWLIGLNMAFSRGMQFGKDIVFTFGPLGFLFLPCFFDVNHWMVAYLCGLAVHFVLVLLVFLLLSKVTSSKWHFIIGSASLFFILPFLTIEHKLMLVALVLLNSVTMYQVGTVRSCLTVSIMSLCLALASAIKFTAAVSTTGIIIAAVSIFTYRRQFLTLAIMVFSCLLAYTGLWILAGQHITNLIPYLRNSIEISAGYNHAMVVSGEKLQLAAGIAGICLFYLIFVYGAITRKQALIVFMLPFLIFAFMAFKCGFVRQDLGHVRVFFALMLFLFSLMYLACKQDIPKPLCFLLLLILCSAMPIFIAERTALESVSPQIMSRRIRSNMVSLKMLANGSSFRQEILRKYKLHLKNKFRLSDALVEYIGKNRIDIIPWDIELLYVYDMNWSPRPIFQSYSAYTKALDSLNAGYYEKSAPDMLLYMVKTIDDRYAVFDEPATFRRILLNYKPLFGGILLRKKDESTSLQRHAISSIEADIGEVIQTPQTDGYLFANVRIEYSLLGKVVTIAYKGDVMRIHLATDEGFFEHRFISSTAENGIFLSSYIATNQDLLDVFDGKPGKAIHSLRFTTGNKWFYKNKIKIEFFEIQPNSFVSPTARL